MKQIDYFFKEHEYHILGTIANIKTQEFVQVEDNSYRRLEFDGTPYVLKVLGIHNVIGYRNAVGKSKKFNWVLPVYKNNEGSYTEMNYSQYMLKRSRREVVEYIRISESDRLKLSNWIKEKRNYRFNVYDYETGSLMHRKCPLPEKLKGKAMISA